MTNRNATFELRQGDTFYERLIFEDSTTSVAINLTGLTIEAFLLLNGNSIELDVVIMNAAEGRLSIGKSSSETATWAVDDFDGYIAITENGVKTSSDTFTVRIIEGAV